MIMDSNNVVIHLYHKTRDKVPSDLRLVAVSNMATGEAALTGEAVPIDKETGAIALDGVTDPEQVPIGDRKNMAYSGK